MRESLQQAEVRGARSSGEAGGIWQGKELYVMVRFHGVSGFCK